MKPTSAYLKTPLRSLIQAQADCSRTRVRARAAWLRKRLSQHGKAKLVKRFHPAI